jgi:hypothetical protein
LKGHDFTGYGKTHFWLHEASGHDLSRAVNAAKSTWALAHEVCFSGISLENEPFSAASSVVPQTQ